MRVFISGLAGFVGPHLANHLLACGDEVTGSYLERPLGLAGVREWQLDLADLAGLERAFGEADPDVVVHLAGRSHVGASWQHMPEYFQTNVVGTDHVLRAAAATTGCRVVFASSAEVYGLVDPSEQPIVETRPVAPRTPYALTKAAAELLAVRAGAVVARTFNLIGPGQDPSFALPAFAVQLAQLLQIAQRSTIPASAGDQGERFLRVGNLSARRDFLHVRDAAAAYRVLAERAEPGGLYNVASGTALSIAEALDRLQAAAGLHVAVSPDPERMRPVDLPLLQGDAGKLRALGWRPERTVDDALSELWRSVGGTPQPTPPKPIDAPALPGRPA